MRLSGELETSLFIYIVPYRSAVNTVVFFGLLVLHHSVATGEHPKNLWLKSSVTLKLTIDASLGG